MSNPMTEAQAERLINLLEMQNAIRTQPCNCAQPTAQLQSPCGTCEPQWQYSQSLARFNEIASREAAAALQNFTVNQQNAWALQQRFLFGVGGGGNPPVA